jgi:hypothetical protein
LCDIWTSAFFVELNNNIDDEMIPTSKRLLDYKQTRKAHPKLIAKCEALSRKHNFFHWELEFPEVFERNGFDVVIGNPAWEMLQFDPREFFITKRPDIANAKNMAIRK